MKAVFFETQGSLDNIQVGQFPDPEVGPGDCLIRVHAAAMNGFEPMMIMGTTALNTPLPMIPCGDISGEIVEVGSDVPDGSWAVGDRVILDPLTRNGVRGEKSLGGASEYTAAHHQQLIRIPGDVSYADAACTTIAYATAHRMVGTRGKITADDTVLVLGATGGVGVATVQFAKLAGATVIACGSSDWKMDKLREIGADEVIDTSSTDFYEWVVDKYGKPNIFGKGGVSVVVNFIGGETWEKSLRCLSPKGRILTCGATAGHLPPTDLRFVWSYELAILGSNGWDSDGPSKVLDMMAQKKLDPVIHRICPLDDAREALAEMYERRIFGKVVFAPAGGE